jgi:lipid-A-disaccharide synthase
MQNIPDTPADSLQLALVAGEASGDLLAAQLLGAMHARWPQARTCGIGGPRMVERGFDSWWAIERLSVRGYAEVLPRLPGLLYLRWRLIQRLRRRRPALFVGVDAPDFNFGVERALKTRGIKTLHFVSPSFWAWRPERLRVLKAAADHVLCLFPFEPALLAGHGIASTYVGHPLAQMIPMAPDRARARAALGWSAQGSMIALLPGSRAAEIDHIAPRFFKASLRLHQRRPELHFALPAVPWLERRIGEIAEATGARAALGDHLHIVAGRSHEVLAACDAALIASGTATLEAALFKVPMVIAYAMPNFSYRLMRRKRLLPWVGLPNILCAPRALLQPGAAFPVDAPFAVPELIQDAASPDALAQAVEDWLDAPAKVAALQARFSELHRELLLPTAERAVDAMQALIGGGSA